MACGQGGSWQRVRPSRLPIRQALLPVSHHHHVFSGHILSTHFVVLPDKRIYPDYFVLIKRPIALSEIKRRLNQNLYKSLDDVKNEFDLCFDNARQYNAEASQIYYDATEMQVSGLGFIRGLDSSIPFRQLSQRCTRT